VRQLTALFALCLFTSAVPAADNGFYLGAGVGASEFQLPRRTSMAVDQ